MSQQKVLETVFISNIIVGNTLYCCHGNHNFQESV